MKRILFVLSVLISSVAYSQTTGFFRYDTVTFQKIGGNSEFKLLNATRGVTGGVLTNMGNGRTAFVTPAAGGGTVTPLGTYKIGVSGTSNVKGLVPGLYTLLDSTATNITIRSDTATMFPVIRSTISGGSVDSAVYRTVFTSYSKTQVDGMRPEPYGMIYNDSNWVAGDVTTDFDIVGSHTVTDSAGLIVLSGGPSAFTASLNVDVNQQYGLTNYHTNLEYWDIWVKFRIIQHGVIGIGIDGTQAVGPSDAIGYINTSSGQSAFINVSTSNLTNSIGDWCIMRVKRDLAATSITVWNVTTGSAPITTKGSYDFTSSGPPRIGQFAIFNHSGKFYVDSLAISSTTSKNAALLLIGTSKTIGFRADFPTRWATLVQDKFSTVVLGCGSSESGDWLTLLPEILALTPQQVLIENPCNDLRDGVSAATTISNIYTIERAIRDAGRDVYFMDAIHETGSPYDAWVTHITGRVSPDSIIKVTEATKQSGALDGDNIHPTVLGHANLAALIINSNKLKHDILNEQAPSRFLQKNATTVSQPFVFNISGTDRNIINGYLTVGTGAVSTGASDIPFRIRGGTNLNLWGHGNSTNMYWRFMNDAANAGIDGIIDFGTLKLQTLSGIEAIGISSGGLVSTKAGLAGVGGNIKTIYVSVGNVGAGEDNLQSYPIPANTLATDGDYLEFSMTFSTPVSSNTVKVYYGATQLGAIVTNSSFPIINVKGTIVRTGATTQRIEFTYLNNGATAGYVTAAETLSGIVTLKGTGEGVSNDDIIQTLTTVKYFPSK